MADSGLRDLVKRIHAIAVGIIQQDGEHAAMFFLRLPTGELETTLFDDVDRPVGDARSSQLAHAVRTTRADAVVVVSEGWAAEPATIPKGGRAGDSPEAIDVLLVAGADRTGAEFVLTTQLQKRLGSIEVTQTEEGGHVPLFDEARAVWGFRLS